MKKFLKVAAIIVVLLGAGGYAAWHFGTNIASAKIIEKAVSTLDNKTLEEVRTYIESDAKVQEIISEVATTDPETLPFQTMGEATRVLITKVGINRLLDISEKAQNGSISKDEVLSEIEGNLSEDEISALKYVLYKELNK